MTRLAPRRRRGWILTPTRDCDAGLNGQIFVVLLQTSPSSLHNRGRQSEGFSAPAQPAISSFPSRFHHDVASLPLGAAGGFRQLACRLRPERAGAARARRRAVAGLLLSPLLRQCL